MRRSAVLGLAPAIVPVAAHAHSPIAGIGSFYSGALHPFVVPEQLMCIVCLGLLLGQRGLTANGRAAAGWVLGIALGIVVCAAADAPATDRWLLGFTFVIGVAVATARRLPASIVISIAALAGLALGLGSSPDGLSGNAKSASLAGTWISASVGMPWVASIADAATRPWQRIGVRMLASWLAASAMLVLALSFLVTPKGKAEMPVPALPSQEERTNGV